VFLTKQVLCVHGNVYYFYFANDGVDIIVKIIQYDWSCTIFVNLKWLLLIKREKVHIYGKQ